MKKRQNATALRTTFESLPVRILEYITSFLDVKSVVMNLSLTSHHFHTFTTTNEWIWIQKYNTYFPLGSYPSFVYFEREENVDSSSLEIDRRFITNNHSLTMSKLKCMQQIRLSHLQYYSNVISSLTALQFFQRRFMMEKYLKKKHGLSLRLQEHGHGELLMTVPDLLHKYFLSADDCTEGIDLGELREIVFGYWGDESNESIVQWIERNRSTLARKSPNLTSIYLGDIDADEMELSWIVQTDITPIFHSLPNLQHFRCKGMVNLELKPFQHNQLISLSIITGGMGREIVKALCQCSLPNLYHLELWLGTKYYGNDTTMEDFGELLSEKPHLLLPSLYYLGLKNCDSIDVLVPMIVHSSLVRRIGVLDLSEGTFSDDGAISMTREIAKYKPDEFCVLELIDLHHNYVSPIRRDQLFKLAIDYSFAIDLSDSRPFTDQRYVVVGE